MTTSTPLALPDTKSNGRVAYTGGVVDDETHKPRSSSNNRANLRNASAEAQQTGRLSTNAPRHPCEPPRSPLSNVSRFKIIDSTLREGEQFATAFFDTNSKMQIVKALDELGVDYIELTSPAASEQSRRDCEDICKLVLRVRHGEEDRDEERRSLTSAYRPRSSHTSVVTWTM
ncbi:Pyruvate carboxyltransferase [Macrophomina phaseolina MS6]|uniref:Pyruvate carboxyltransferase n=1 Tax=Macrophomina phaseolina (strain MS6) TaxID=1126212 RepID=K2QX39_MACPH|nr:Pyruvate carboxyltransferase [Macrophomina phaseolina MS6]